jgi:hypothetical protein
MSKFETMSEYRKSEFPRRLGNPRRITEFATVCLRRHSNIWISSLAFVSDFVLRISDFAPQSHRESGEAV